MADRERYVVLGSSGWVGHYLVHELARRRPEAEIHAVYGAREPSFSAAANVRIVPAPAGYSAAVKELPPATLLHLGRGETDDHFLEHRRLIATQKERGRRYLFASTFNAVDATLDRPHREEDPPGAQSPYGRYKARCEEELARAGGDWVAFRFASTHGWAPNREARTQAFLAKLKAGEAVGVHRGVVQNRTFVGELAAQIALLAGEPAARGVFHLGAADASEEIDFLRALAAAFGYPAGLVREDGASECNAHMVLRKLPELFPAYRVPSEAEMLAGVAAQPELSGFRRTS